MLWWTIKLNEISTRLHSHPQWNCKISASNNNQYNIGSAHTMATNVTTRSFRKQQISHKPQNPWWKYLRCCVCKASGGDWCGRVMLIMSLTQEKPISLGSFTWYDTRHHSSLSRAAPGPGQWTRDQQTDSGGREERGEGLVMGCTARMAEMDGRGRGGGWIVGERSCLVKYNRWGIRYHVIRKHFKCNVRQYCNIHPWL